MCPHGLRQHLPPTCTYYCELIPPEHIHRQWSGPQNAPECQVGPVFTDWKGWKTQSGPWWFTRELGYLLLHSSLTNLQRRLHIQRLWHIFACKLPLLIPAYLDTNNHRDRQKTKHVIPPSHLGILDSEHTVTFNTSVIHKCWLYYKVTYTLVKYCVQCFLHIHTSGSLLAFLIELIKTDCSCPCFFALFTLFDGNS